MSLHQYVIDRLNEHLAQLATAVMTLPEAQLVSDRDALRAQCTESIGAKPEALALKIYNAELARRHVGELDL